MVASSVMNVDRYLELEQRDLGYRVDPAEILSLGDQAARMHVEKGEDLTGAVLKVVEGRKLNPAHVCRIAEEANTQAYLKLYDKASGPSRVVHFEGGPARTLDILESVFGETGPSESDERKVAMTLDYRLPPSKPTQPKRKTASLTSEDLFLEKMSDEKVARMMGEGMNSTGGRAQLYHILKGTQEKLSADINSLRYQMEERARDLVKMAERYLTEGHSPAEIARVMYGDRMDAGSGAVIRGVMQKVGADLNVNTIPWGREPSEKHPLREKTAEMVLGAQLLERKMKAHDEVVQKIAEVRKQVVGR